MADSSSTPAEKPEATQKVKRERKSKTRTGDGFNHEKYTKSQCKNLNKSMAENKGGASATTVYLPVRDDLGPFALVANHQWTKDEKKAFLSSGKLPMTLKDVYANDQIHKQALTMVFVQIRGKSVAFPGHADDLGRTACFLRITHAQDKPWVVCEPVDGPRGSDGNATHIAFLPNEVVNTAELKVVNDEFLKHGKSEVRKIVIKQMSTQPGPSVDHLAAHGKPEDQPTAPADAVETFNQQKYSDEMCTKLLDSYIRRGWGMIFKLNDELGPRYAYTDWTWTASEKQAYLSNKTLPVQCHEIPAYQVMVMIYFAQFRLNSEIFPGYADDLGRPESFIHLTRSEPCYAGIYFLEAIDEPRIENADAENYYLIPSWELSSTGGETATEGFSNHSQGNVSRLVSHEILNNCKHKLDDISL